VLKFKNKFGSLRVKSNLNYSARIHSNSLRVYYYNTETEEEEEEEEDDDDDDDDDEIIHASLR
jgi:hypothetical protein